MSKIVWIASYPKSGNTWVRFLVCNLLFGPVESAAALNVLAPDVHELGPDPAVPERSLLMKTHFVCTAALPLRAQTAAAIYVVRDPADVMLSNFHYGRRSSNGSRQADLNTYIDSFIANRGDQRWRNMGMGTWDENVRSWTVVRQEFPVLRIRYEDLLADGPAIGNILCRCLGVTRTPGEIASALTASSFDRMQKIEKADIDAQRVGIFYKPYLRQPIAAGLRFMRSGKQGEAARAMTFEQRARFEAVFGAAGRELGYGTAP